ncbi:MAG: PssD/Cps14F family polysaccharide biosynthesis glycosyltransferase [Candidatus Diapherotrites archaeon]
MKLCLACSAGGHLAEMLQLEEFYSKREHFFLTFRRPDSEDLAKREKVFFVERPARNPLAFILNFFQSLNVLLKEKPDLVLATGADVTASICLLAKILRKKMVFIESFCRPFRPSWSGRIVHPFADLFIVQWPEVHKAYKKAVFGGPIFLSGGKKAAASGKGSGVFVSVGTHPQQFNRLLEKVGELVGRGKIKEKVFAQSGYTKFKAKNFESVDFIAPKEFEEKVKGCKLFITHGGEGNIGLGLQLGKKMVVVPRLKKFGEHSNDHQLELTKAVEGAGQALAVYGINELEGAIGKAKNFTPKKLEGGKIIEILERFVSNGKTA